MPPPRLYCPLIPPRGRERGALQGHNAKEEEDGSHEDVSLVLLNLIHGLTSFVRLTPHTGVSPFEVQKVQKKLCTPS